MYFIPCGSDFSVVHSTQDDNFTLENSKVIIDFTRNIWEPTDVAWSGVCIESVGELLSMTKARDKTLTPLELARVRSILNA